MKDRTLDLTLPDPFSIYLEEKSLRPDARIAAADMLMYVAMAKRMLIQERCRDFTAADVIALAAMIESRHRFQFELNRP